MTPKELKYKVASIGKIGIDISGSKKARYTVSEIVAYQLLHRSYGSTTDEIDIHGAADQIILLSEKIKAERAILAMELI
jgi:hypothetical protein